MFFDPQDFNRFARRVKPLIGAGRADKIILNRLCRVRDCVRIGLTTFHLPKSADEPVRVTRPLSFAKTLRSTLTIRIEVTDGQGRLSKDVPLITMIRAAEEASRLLWTIKALPQPSHGPPAADDGLQIVDRHLANYVNPDLDDISQPVTGQWMSSDITAMIGGGFPEGSAIEAMERRRVEHLGEITKITGIPLYPWAPYETSMFRRPTVFGFYAAPGPFLNLSPTFGIIEPANLHRLEHFSAVRAVHGTDYIPLAYLEKTDEMITASMGAMDAQSRFISLLLSMARRNGGFGATLADVRLTLDLMPDRDVFAAWPAMIVLGLMPHVMKQEELLQEALADAEPPPNIPLN